jgi:hypothetical protein
VAASVRDARSQAPTRPPIPFTAADVALLRLVASDFAEPPGGALSGDSAASDLVKLAQRIEAALEGTKPRLVVTKAQLRLIDEVLWAYALSAASAGPRAKTDPKHDLLDDLLGRLHGAAAQRATAADS